MFAGLHDDLDGIDAGTTNLEEVVSSTHLLDFQDVGEDAAEEFFLLTLRSLVFAGTFHLRCRQCLAVDLAVGCHRHTVHLHIGIGHHVVSQRRGGKRLTNILVAERRIRFQGIVEHQMLIAHHLAHLGSSLTDTLDVEGFALDFTEFDTETTQFHLRVDTTDVL